MRNVLRGILIVLLIPVYLMAYVSIHEIGHTTLARLLGDPDAVYHLIKIDQYSRAIGYTDYDISKLSWGANLITSIGGVLATQSVALAALFLLRVRQSSHRWLQQVLGIIAFTFAFDLPFQLIQALAYKGLLRWPTGVDLIDVILLLQMRLDLSQPVLKGSLVLITALYLALFVWLDWQNRLTRKRWEPTLGAA